MLVMGMLAGCAKASAPGGSSDQAPGSSEANAAQGQSAGVQGGAQVPSADGTGSGQQAEGSQTGGRTVEEMLADKNRVDEAVVADGVSYGLKQGLKTYLLLGVDDPNTDGYKNGTTDHWSVMCDVIQLYVMDEKNSSYSVLQISRDTMAYIDVLNAYGKPITQSKQQLSFAHGYTGDANINAQNVERAVSRLLGGIEIDGYVSAMYGAIPYVNDALGGVTVTLDDDFTAADPAMKEGTTLNLQGMQALYYLRYRKGIGEQTNSSRMMRQQKYLDAFSNKLRSEIKTNSAVINSIYNAASPYMVSDMSSGAITNLMLKGASFTKKASLTLSGSEQTVSYSSGNTHNELTVTQDALDQTVLDLFYEPLD